MTQRGTNYEYRLRGYVVPARSITAIRTTAVQVREVLKLNDSPPRLEAFLESLSEYGITVDVQEGQEFMLAGVEAACNPETATIALTSATYSAARSDDPRTRFTIFHELGHFVLGHTKALGRSNIVPRAFIDSEWQADQFAAEMTMPLDVIMRHRLRTPRAIATFCGVSPRAASYRLDQLIRTGALK